LIPKKHPQVSELSPFYSHWRPPEDGSGGSSGPLRKVPEVPDCRRKAPASGGKLRKILQPPDSVRRLRRHLWPPKGGPGASPTSGTFPNRN